MAAVKKNRVCQDCKKLKPAKEFYRRKNPYKTKTIHRISYCRVCFIKRTRKWQTKNKDRYLAYQVRYTASHKV